MGKEFDVIAFEEKHEKDFKKSRSIPLEISSQHCYTDGITYFYLHDGDTEIGQYYRDPWGQGWYWLSSITGEKNHCPSRAIALTNIQRIWMRWAS